MSLINTSDKSISHNKPRVGRIPKAEKYAKERQETLDKINKILGITDTNNKFYLCDITEEKETQILNMKNDIKIFFNCNRNRIFSKESVKREFLSLIKIVYKYMNIELIHTRKNIERNNKIINTGLYIINLT